MLLPYLLLEQKFNQLCADRKKEMIDINITHNPTINEGGREKAIKNILNPDWIGKPNNLSCVDMVKNKYTIEYKSSKLLSIIPLNSTPITKKTYFSELTKKVQKELSHLYDKNFIFTKEYLFFVEDFNLHICIDPEIEQLAFENRTEYDNSMQEANKVQLDSSFYHKLENNSEIMELIKNDKELYETYLNNKTTRENNKILSNYENKDQYSLYNNNPDSLLNLRQRSMWSYDLPSLLKNNDLTDDQIKHYSSIVILPKQKFLMSHLTRYSNLIIRETQQLVILGYSK